MATEEMAAEENESCQDKIKNQEIGFISLIRGNAVNLGKPERSDPYKAQLGYSFLEPYPDAVTKKRP